MKNILFFITILLNALSLGFFFAWSVSVVLGTKKIGAFSYLETMQSINKEILNPVFFIVFFGSLVSLIFNAYFQNDNKPVFVLIVISAAIYLVGTIGVTGFGNVPLNNELEALNIQQLSPAEMKNFRAYFEAKWNHFHSIRTFAALASFTLLLISNFIQKSI